MAVDQTPLVERASFTLAPGELVAVLGPNGAGKTSLLRGALGLQRHSGGQALLADRPVAEHSAIDRARLLSYLPQLRPLAWPTPVRDLVALGRFAYGAALGALHGDDEHAVDEALKACDLISLAQRRAHELSGGELARAHFARALAAQTPLLVADEPVAALDPYHQLKIMALIADYVANGGGALVVLHDVSLAARFADRLLWMKQGRILAEGTPQETLTAEQLAEVYDVQAVVNGAQVEILAPL
ncbi:MAG: ABC transporter ATP-binding protein [Pseudomonadota bacterium]